jgi:multidrug efflux system outer membrane protein
MSSAHVRRRFTRFSAVVRRTILLISLTPMFPANVRAEAGVVSSPQTVVPTVSDPMLAPPPVAAREIQSWDEALNLIRTRSPEYVSSYENVLRAEANSRIALAAVLPTLNGQLSYTHQFLTENIALGGVSFVSPPPNVFAANAAFNWSIINPRGLYGLGTASRNTEAAKLSFQDQRRQITVAVVNAMLSSLAAERVAELNRVGLRAALERLALAQARLKFGQGTPLDVDRGDQDVAAARALLITGDESLREAREELGRALGSSVAFAAPVNLDLEEFERAVARTCRLNEDIEQRPDIAAAKKRVEIAERAIHDAELQIAPTLGVVSQAGVASQASLGPKEQWMVEGVVNLPFYDGGARYGMRRDAIAAAEQARQALVTARVNAVIASARAQRSVSVFQASREVALIQRDLARRVDERTRSGYAGGLGTSLDLVTSAQALRQAEITLVLQEFQVGEARANAVLANAQCLY